MGRCGDRRCRAARPARTSTAHRGPCPGHARAPRRRRHAPGARSWRHAAAMSTPLTIDAFARGLRERKFSASEITAEILRRIDERNAGLNAFILVMDEAARRQALRTGPRAGGGPRPRTTPRRPDLGQRPLRHRRDADDRRVAGPRRACRRGRRGGHRPRPPGRRGHRRQDEPPRIRLRHDERRVGVRSGTQPARSGAVARRIERRIGGERRRRHGARHDRIGYGRVDQDSGRRLRHRRLEADVRRDQS